MLLRLILRILFFIAIVHAELLTVLIYAKPLSSYKTFTLGAIHYNKESTQAYFASTDLSIDDGEYCIGTKDLPNLECFTYTKLSKSTLVNKLLLVNLDADKNIAHLSMSSAPSPLVLESADSVIHVSVSFIEHDPKPIKNTKAAQPQKSKNQPEDDEEETPKSWIQKNWMYVVPPLLIMFLLLGEDEKKK